MLHSPRLLVAAVNDLDHLPPRDGSRAEADGLGLLADGHVVVPVLGRPAARSACPGTKYKSRIPGTLLAGECRHPPRHLSVTPGAMRLPDTSDAPTLSADMVLGEPSRPPAQDVQQEDLPRREQGEVSPPSNGAWPGVQS